MDIKIIKPQIVQYSITFHYIEEILWKYAAWNDAKQQRHAFTSPHVFSICTLGGAHWALQTDSHQFYFPPKGNQFEAAVEFRVFCCVGPMYKHTTTWAITHMNWLVPDCAKVWITARGRPAYSLVLPDMFSLMSRCKLQESSIKVHLFRPETSS